MMIFFVDGQQCLDFTSQASHSSAKSTLFIITAFYFWQ
jgi:hypothetical protein